MAGFTFETMTQAQAGAFTSSDLLFFQSSAPTSITATYAPQTGLTVATITLSNGTHTLSFDASAFTATNTTFISDGSHLAFGVGGGLVNVGANTSAAFGLDDPTLTTPNDYGFIVAAGDHAIHGGSGDDVVNLTGLTGGAAAGDGNDNIWGGDGSDEITLGGGNSHVYGGTNTAGAADGGDTITVGDGNNYINGNAGNDAIAVGDGANRVQGGAGDDQITFGAGNNAVNGNKGDDTIGDGTSTGNNSLRGGQGDDTITAGHGSDTLSGDLGNDTLIVGGNAVDHHVTVLSGGDGDDVFDFHGGGAGTAVDISATGVLSAATYGAHTFYQEITDFTAGSDTIDLATAGAMANFKVLASSYANVLEAFNAATNDFATSAHTTDAAQVGGDTYLFYKDGGATSVIKLDGVTASTLDFHSIV
jgi:Ca2+-binding RTX toxin-like protein